MDNKDLVQKAVEHFRDYPQPCCLCGITGSFVGIFIPDNPQKYGAPENKTRFFVYSLCDNCERLKDKATLVENKFLSNLHSLS